MAGRRVTVVLEQDYGHPSNNVSKGCVLEVMAKLLPKVIENTKGEDTENPVWFRLYDVVSIEVD